MKLSQLIHAMYKHDTIIVNAYGNHLPIDKKRIYRGEVKGIYKDNPINKCHVKFIAAVQDAMVVEIAVDERKDKFAPSAPKNL